MIKSIEKLKVRIDQNLNRAEKSEALSEDVVKIESKITSLKQVRQILAMLINHTLVFCIFGVFLALPVCHKKALVRFKPHIILWKIRKRWSCR